MVEVGEEQEQEEAWTAVVEGVAEAGDEAEVFRGTGIRSYQWRRIHPAVRPSKIRLRANLYQLLFFCSLLFLCTLVVGVVRVATSSIFFECFASGSPPHQLGHYPRPSVNFYHLDMRSEIGSK